MPFLAAPLLFFCLAAVEGSSIDGIAIQPGESISGSIARSDPLIRTPGIDAIEPPSQVRTRTHLLTVRETGTYTIELRSYFFDAYLVLRDGGSEAILAEDDDGLIDAHSRISCTLNKGIRYSIVTGAKYDGTGAYELSVLSGKPRPLTPAERILAEIDDAVTRVERFEKAFGPEHEHVAAALHHQGFLLWKTSRYSEALPLMQRAHAIQLARLGPENAQTVLSLQNVAAQYDGLEDHETAERYYRDAAEKWENVKPRDPLSSATCLLDLGSVLRDQGKIDEAVEVCRRALEIRTSALGPDHPDTAEGLSCIAILREKKGKFEEAEKLFRQALALQEKGIGPESTAVATTLRNLADLLLKTGDVAESDALLERALGIRTRAFGASHPDTARILESIVKIREEQGRYPEAEKLIRRTLAIYQTVYKKKNTTIASARSNLASILFKQGRFDEAEAECLLALEIEKSAYGEDSPYYAMSLHNLAGVLFKKGKYQDAVKHERHALKILEASADREGADIGIVLNMLGMILKEMGYFEEAEPVFRRALDIIERTYGTSNSTYATIITNLATVRQAQGKYAEAEESFREAVTLFAAVQGANHPNTASALNNLGLLLFRQKRYEESEQLLRKVLGLRRAILGSDHPQTATTLNNLASALQYQNKYDEAEPLFEEALGIREKRLGPFHPKTAEALNNLALIVREQEKFDEAKKLLERAVEIKTAALGRGHPETATSVVNLGHLEMARNDTKKAWGYFEQAYSMDRLHLVSLFSSATETERFRYTTKKFNYLIYLLCLATDQNYRLEEKKFINQAYTYLLATKGQVFRSTSSLRRKIHAAMTPGQSKKLKAFYDAQSELSRLCATKQADDPEMHTSRIKELIRERDDLEEELANDVAATWIETTPKVRELSGKLPEGSVLVDFYIHWVRHWDEKKDGRVVSKARWDQPRLSAWILHAGEENVIHRNLGNARDVQAQAVVDLENVADSRGWDPPDPYEEGGETSGRVLREILWDPIRGDVGDAALVFISPDGFLAEIPFGTLQEEEGSYLIESRSFVYLQDAQTLLRDPPEQAGNKAPSTLLVGAVDYNRRDGGTPDEAEARHAVQGKWSLLDHTGPEAVEIAEVYRKTFGSKNGCVVVRDSAATEEYLKENLPGNQVIHLATHGFFQSTLEADGKSVPWNSLVFYPQGLFSGLVCAGANLPVEEDRDDGLLTADEAAWLNIEGCHLVVLSACETGIGMPRSGEGLMSLRRAFHHAGAETVISSLWQVPDRPSRELMVAFYRKYWQDGKSAARALREAQIEMLARNRKRFDNEGRPGTWGAFVLSGEWR